MTSSGRHGAAAWWALVDAATPAQTLAAERTTEPRRSQATHLVDLALTAGVELWHDSASEAYISLPVAGHVEHHGLSRRVVKDWLSRLYFDATKQAAGGDAIPQALAVLCGKAKFEGKAHSVGLRVGECDGAVYLDLGDPQWRSVRVTRDGWAIVGNAPVRFRRPASMRALPDPVPGT